MQLPLASYAQQCATWPAQGRVLLACHDEHTVVVYQAYRSDIALHAVEHQRFGGRWSTERMSWIKPGFLWMMYRSGWASKEGQEHVLAIRLRRSGFEEVLSNAVPSTFDPTAYADEAAWREAGTRTTVRLQWDPDHDPRGEKVPRRAIQLGLKDSALRRFNQEWILSIDDITPMVREQAISAAAGDWDRLLTPVERPLTPWDPAVRARLGL